MGEPWFCALVFRGVFFETYHIVLYVNIPCRKQIWDGDISLLLCGITLFVSCFLFSEVWRDGRSLDSWCGMEMFEVWLVYVRRDDKWTRIFSPYACAKSRWWTKRSSKKEAAVTCVLLSPALFRAACSVFLDLQNLVTLWARRDIDSYTVLRTGASDHAITLHFTTRNSHCSSRKKTCFILLKQKHNNTTETGHSPLHSKKCTKD